MLFKSELITPQKNVRNTNFKQCSIPDLYLSSDGNYDTSLVGIEIYDE